MLLDLREKVRNSKPIKYTLITVICIPFALVGIGSYLTGGSAPPVATVNGEEISQVALDQAYRFQRAQLAQMFGGQLPEGLASDTALREQARDQLINQSVVQSAVEEAGFAVGDQTLARAIQNNPAFQLDGQFNQEAYRRALQGGGRSPAQFEQDLRSQTALNQFSEGLVESGFTLPGEAKRADELSRQIRKVDVLNLSLAAKQEGIEVSDEDIQAYFDENADSYQFPDRAKVQYIELNATDQAEAIDILDEDALAYYEDNKRTYVTPEQRSVSHILLEADGDSEVEEKTKQATDLIAQLNEGGDFAALASEFSDDPGSADAGGSLGPILPGQMVPVFENAVNDLTDIGGISAPVISQYGVHIIKLDEIQAESGKPFEEVKDDIVATLKQNQSDQEFNEIREQLEETAFDFSDELTTAAAETGLEVQTTDWVDVESDNGELFSNSALMQAVFSDEVLLDGLNSEVIQLAPKHVVVLRVLDSEGPRPKTIDDVRDEIKTTLQSMRAAEQLDALAAELKDKVSAGEDMAALAEADDAITAQLGESVERSGSALDGSVVNSIFSAAKPTEGSATVSNITTANGDRVVYAIRSIELAESPEEDAPVAAVANPRAGSAAFTAMVQSMRSRAKIDLNDSALVPGAGSAY